MLVGVTPPPRLTYEILNPGPGVLCPLFSCSGLSFAPMRALFFVYFVFLGTTIEGEEFDSSFKRGQPTAFAPNQVRATQFCFSAVQCSGPCVWLSWQTPVVGERQCGTTKHG